MQNVTSGNQTDTFTYTTANSLISGAIAAPAGGNLSFAGTSVTLEGTITTQGGSVTVNGTVSLFTGGSVTLQGNIDTQGGDLNVYADTISVDTQSGPVTLSTRDLAAVPGDPANDPSVGNSVAINFTGVNITLGSDSGISQGNANLYSQVKNENGTTYTAGAITLTASEVAGGGTGGGFNPPIIPVKLDSTTTGITLNAATVDGGDITFNADASSLHANNDTANNQSTTPKTLINGLEQFSLVGCVATSTATATINLGAGSAIVGDSFTANADGTSDAEGKPSGIPGVSLPEVVVWM